MSESSNASAPVVKTWGTPESHWPFPRPVAPPTEEDRARALALSPDQRVQWLLTVLRLLEIQFGHRIPRPQPPERPE